MNRHSHAGFTLIELLVVIGILTLLVAAFAPNIFTSRLAADQAADRANLTWHFTNFTKYYNDHKQKLPPGTGHKFVLGTWLARVVEKTPENFERYWVPGRTDGDPRYDELKQRGVDNIWKTADEIDSLDTQYAGPGPEMRRQKIYGSGRRALMCDDNEFGPTFDDNMVNVLLGDGQVRSLLVDEHFIEHGFDPEEEDAYVEVGPNSIYPLLQKMEK